MYFCISTLNKQTSANTPFLGNKNISYPELAMEHQSIYLPSLPLISRCVSYKRNDTDLHILKYLVHETHLVQGIVHSAQG